MSIDIGTSSRILRVEEGDNVTMTWTLDHYDESDVIDITKDINVPILKCLGGFHKSFAASIKPFGDCKRTIGFTIRYVTVSHSGVYSLRYKGQLKITSLFVFGKFIHSPLVDTSLSINE